MENKKKSIKNLTSVLVVVIPLTICSSVAYGLVKVDYAIHELEENEKTATIAKWKDIVEHPENYRYGVNNRWDYVITIQNVDGTTENHLVTEYSMEEFKYTINPYFEDIYCNYASYGMDSLVYVDRFTCEVVSIKYPVEKKALDRTEGLFTKSEHVEYSYGYAIHEIIEKTPAITLASGYYGAKDYYTYDELTDMLKDLDEQKKMDGMKY